MTLTDTWLSSSLRGGVSRLAMRAGNGLSSIDPRGISGDLRSSSPAHLTRPIGFADISNRTFVESPKRGRRDIRTHSLGAQKYPYTSRLGGAYSGFLGWQASWGSLRNFPSVADPDELTYRLAEKAEVGALVQQSELQPALAGPQFRQKLTCAAWQLWPDRTSQLLTPIWALAAKQGSPRSWLSRYGSSTSFNSLTFSLGARLLGPLP